jgi:hypothetical protein
MSDLIKRLACSLLMTLGVLLMSPAGIIVIVAVGSLGLPLGLLFAVTVIGLLTLGFMESGRPKRRLASS